MFNLLAVAPVDVAAATTDFGTWMAAAGVAGFALYMTPQGIRFIKKAWRVAAG